MQTLHRQRIGDLTFTSGRWPRPYCEVEDKRDGYLWKCYGLSEKRARREARRLAIFYGYWPTWLPNGASHPGPKGAPHPNPEKVPVLNRRKP